MPGCGAGVDPVAAYRLAVDLGGSAVDEVVLRLDELVFDLAVDLGAGLVAVLLVRSRILTRDHLGVLELLVVLFVVMNDLHHTEVVGLGGCHSGHRHRGQPKGCHDEGRCCGHHPFESEVHWELSS